jgi:MFS family permease
VQTLRALVYGFGAVILGSTLASEGLSDTAVGAVFTVMLAGMASASISVGRWGDRVGRRRSYRLLLATMGLSGAVFALTSWLPALLLAAATGTLSTDANESGPITSLEQAMLADAPPAARARLFGRYNAAAYLAGSVGSLCAGGPAAFRHLLQTAPSDQRWLLAFPMVAAACVAIAGRLPTTSHSQVVPGRRSGSSLTTSRRSVRRLAALFAVDAFGGGLVVQSFLVFWFHRRYGASTELMGTVFFAAGLLQAGSSLVAGWLAPRVGLLQTMVFTHLPSNVLLAAVPFMPTVGWAVAILLARFALSQMDVPARQAFIAALVQPSERTAAAAYTNTARYLGRPAGPALAAVLMQQTVVAAPFLAGGLVKVAYDLVVYAAFRRALSRTGS